MQLRERKKEEQKERWREVKEGREKEGGR